MSGSLRVKKKFVPNFVLKHKSLFVVIYMPLCALTEHCLLLFVTGCRIATLNHLRVLYCGFYVTCLQCINSYEAAEVCKEFDVISTYLKALFTDLGCCRQFEMAI